MAGYRSCIDALAKVAGRTLTDDEVSAIFERVHKAALDIKAGRVKPGSEKVSGKLASDLGTPKAETENLVVSAARLAAADLEAEAANARRQAYLQVTRLGARTADVGRLEAEGLKPLDAVNRILARDYSGRVNVESLEQRVYGYETYFLRKLLDTWDGLGHDYVGFFQDRGKMLDLIREIRGEDTGNPLARRGAEALQE